MAGAATKASAQKRGESQVSQKTKKAVSEDTAIPLYGQRAILLHPPKVRGGLFVRHTQAGLLTEASNAVVPLLGMRLPMSLKNHSANTATALCGI